MSRRCRGSLKKRDFRKYNLEFPLVYMEPPLATAAMLGVMRNFDRWGVGLVRTVVGGNNDLVFIAESKIS